jgi:manganese oxidase
VPRYARAVLSTFLLLVAATSSAQTPRTGKTRVYYIAADEVLWNYAPTGADAISGTAFKGAQDVWTKRGPTTIGTTYKKALFREYTDGTFSTLKPRSAEWEHLGFLGPVIHAEVGDSIRVVFRNNGNYPYSVHPHGVIYDKDSEGAPYVDGTSGKDKEDDGVPPGRTYTYRWFAPERAGPTASEPSSAFWMYHSHVQEAMDVNSGLVGPMIITARGRAKPDGSPNDVDREIVMAFAEIDENMSHYIEGNIKQFAMEPEKTERWRGGPTFTHPLFVTNLKESMNGFLYGNGPMPRVTVGERVRWYVMSTTNFEVHAPHWHGNVVTAQHMRTDVLNLGTMGMIVADMLPDNPGTWLFHCHIEPHQTAGMSSRFVVEPRGTRTVQRGGQ